ncbi:MAG: hypothetical protein IH947_05370 [Bacteroidetes bacterium]|nr:hypothetical protein [Bacteroidota bacterium]
MKFNVLRKISGILVAVLLTAFSGVFICDNLCDFDIAHAGHHHSPDHQFAGNKPASHSHHDNVVNKHEHGNGDDNHGQDIPDDCCDDETHPLFNTLIKKKTESFDLEVKLTGIHWDFVHDFIQLISHNGDQAFSFAGASFAHVPPPLQGRYMRVKLCSFLN